MIAVLFEVTPYPERRQDYLDHASALKPLLEGIDGFVSVERFQSLADPGKLLSLSVFRDEEALVQWRNSGAHCAAQKAGRAELFADYRLRIATVMRDYGLHERGEAPSELRTRNG